MRIEGPRLHTVLGSEVRMPEYMKEGFLQDLTRPIAIGERVNMHVIPSVHLPEPDYDAMQRVITGSMKAKNQSAKDEKVA